jgi:xanthine dehydrogenase accessory factor
VSGALVVVRGSGDVGSAVAHRLFTTGFPVVISDEAAPAAPRRGMSFTDAIFDGKCTLEGVEAVLVNDLKLLHGVLRAHAVLPVAVSDFFDLIDAIEPQVLVDARMRKRARPEVQIDLALLTIGLGPNFIAGQNTHWVVETQWGEALGTVLCEGTTNDLAGEPRTFEGHSRDRFVYAPSSGRFSTAYKIGDLVEAGQAVARMEDETIRAPLSGMLRGLAHDGAIVAQGAKVVEVDPRCDPSQVFGIGERPGKIADGVLDAVQEWTKRVRPAYRP